MRRSPWDSKKGSAVFIGASGRSLAGISLPTWAFEDTMPGHEEDTWVLSAFRMPEDGGDVEEDPLQLRTLPLNMYRRSARLIGVSP